MSTSLVLLHSPLSTAAQWGGLPGELRALGAHVTVPEITDDDRPPYAARYIARASLEIAANAPGGPLLLAAAGAAGPLLPGIGAAQRAARRPIAGYLLIDALLPQPGTVTREDLHAAQAAPAGPAGRIPEHGTGAPPRRRPPDFSTEPLPSVADWPDAPCGYLATCDSGTRGAHLASLRGWPAGHAPGATGTALARALLDLAARL
ncbi:hypothetical protein ACFOVU_19285 [Nocardiopsis sediminis]|uniref:Alpha/beta hydrolase n=1 Tax=Nocardiopsis sediminis TaxID=1778267 RepID=A0ABV8FSV1_9ACTN